MKALGLVETKGLLAAIEASDTMLKTSEVMLTKKEIVGGGLVTVIVTGDVAAVKTAIEAAANAVKQIANNLLVTTHVIARPDESIAKMTLANQEENSSKTEKTIVDPVEEISEVLLDEAVMIEKNLSKSTHKATEIDLMNWGKSGAKGEIEKYLAALKVNDLRQLAKEQKHFTINNKEVQRANKEQLINELMQYFTKSEMK